MDFFDIYPLSIIGVLSAVLCGGIIGLERQIFGKPAGVRTSALICLGAYLFITMSLTALGPGPGDVTRVLGQVVSGIGFLGAGVIISREEALLGVTSAAVIWVLAAMGALIGFGYYTSAYFLTIVILSILLGVEWIERTYKAVIEQVGSTLEDQKPRSR